MTPLYACRQDGLTFTESWEVGRGLFKNSSPTTAILYTPNRCILARVTEQGDLEAPVLAASGVPLRVERLCLLDAVFEARVFGESHELRWLHSDGGYGTVVIISELPVSVEGWNALPERSAHEVLDQCYLLWGKGANSNLPSGWSIVAEARIGALPVPLLVNDKERVQLNTREYLAEIDKYGNVGVIEERLVGLSAVESCNSPNSAQEVRHE